MVVTFWTKSRRPVFSDPIIGPWNHAYMSSGNISIQKQCFDSISGVAWAGLTHIYKGWVARFHDTECTINLFLFKLCHFEVISIKTLFRSFSMDFFFYPVTHNSRKSRKSCFLIANIVLQFFLSNYRDLKLFWGILWYFNMYWPAINI